MKAKISSEVKLFIHCPGCDAKTSSFTHLKIGQSFGPWYCDSCGTGYQGRIGEDGRPDIELAKNQQKEIHTLVLLKLPVDFEEQPIYFVFKSSTSVDPSKPETTEEVQAHNEYFYEEHTCPSNWLRVTVLHGEDNDPHGLFHHVQTIPMPSKEEFIKIGIPEEEQWWLTEEDERRVELTSDHLRLLFSKAYEGYDKEVIDHQPDLKGVTHVS